MTVAFSCDHAGNCSRSTGNPAISKYRNMYLKSIELIDIIDIDGIATQGPRLAGVDLEFCLWNEGLGSKPPRMWKNRYAADCTFAYGKVTQGKTQCFVSARACRILHTGNRRAKR